MVSYSYRAAKALALLKRPYNDVDIFVEDTGNHNMWLLLVRKMIPSGVKLSSVNMLGGRDAVVSACKADQSNTGRRKLYIIDGDFDYLLGMPKPKLKYLYRISAYSIENLLLSEEAMLHIGLESNPLANEATLAATLNYKALEAEADRAFRPLFVSYATSFQLNRRAQTVAFPVGKLLNSSVTGATVCPTKLRGRVISVLRSTVTAVGIVPTQTTRNVIKARAAALPLKQVASGKDYLLPFMMMRFKARCGYSGNREQFKVALARSYDAGADPYLRRRLAQIAA